MAAHLISGATANDAWRKAVAILLDPQASLRQPSRGGDTLELLHVTLEISYVRTMGYESNTVDQPRLCAG